MPRRARAASGAYPVYLLLLLLAGGTGLLSVGVPFLDLPSFPPAVPAPARLLDLPAPPTSLHLSDFAEAPWLQAGFGLVLLGAVLGLLRRPACVLALVGGGGVLAGLMWRIRDLEDTQTPLREIAGWIVPTIGLEAAIGLYLAVGAAGLAVTVGLLGAVHKR